MYSGPRYLGTLSALLDNFDLGLVLFMAYSILEVQ
jgi:hypothetical protein